MIETNVAAQLSLISGLIAHSIDGFVTEAEKAAESQLSGTWNRPRPARGMASKSDRGGWAKLEWGRDELGILQSQAFACRTHQPRSSAVDAVAVDDVVGGNVDGSDLRAVFAYSERQCLMASKDACLDG
jgi:hypothetical protein